jgi:hypothetical protein
VRAHTLTKIFPQEIKTSPPGLSSRLRPHPPKRALLGTFHDWGSRASPAHGLCITLLTVLLEGGAVSRFAQADLRGGASVEPEPCSWGGASGSGSRGRNAASIYVCPSGTQLQACCVHMTNTCGTAVHYAAGLPLSWPLVVCSRIRRIVSSAAALSARACNRVVHALCWLGVRVTACARDGRAGGEGGRKGGREGRTEGRTDRGREGYTLNPNPRPQTWDMSFCMRCRVFSIMAIMFIVASSRTVLLPFTLHNHSSARAAEFP